VHEASDFMIDPPARPGGYLVIKVVVTINLEIIPNTI
jgi:hypothetical protein